MFSVPPRKPARKAQEPQFKVYKANMKRFWPWAIGAALVSLITIASGVWELTVGIPKELNEPGLRLLTGYVPIALALMLLMLPVLAYKANYRRQFTFRPDCLLYENGPQQQLPVRWRDLTLLRPQRMKGTHLVATVSDGTQFARIEMFFFPEFHEMITEIESQRRAGRSGAHTV